MSSTAIKEGFVCLLGVTQICLNLILITERALNPDTNISPFGKEV